jgi:hypothetical protein
LFGSSGVINIRCINPLGTFPEGVKEQHHLKIDEKSVNPEETVFGCKTVTKTDISVLLNRSKNYRRTTFNNNIVSSLKSWKREAMFSN